jgi:hypothetical protein
MSFGKKDTKPVDPTLAGMDVSAEPTNQETVVLPYVAGQYTVTAHWITPSYNQRAVEAPSTTPGKK